DARSDFDLTKSRPFNKNRQVKDNDQRRTKPANHFCAKCNAHTNHTTDDHVECEYCKRPGHTRKNCRKLAKEQDKDRPHNRSFDHHKSDRSDRHHDRYQPYNRNDDRYRPKDTRNDRGHRNGMSYPDNYQMHPDYHIELNSLFLPSSQINTDEAISDHDFAAIAHLVDSVSVIDGKDNNSLADNNNLSINDVPLNEFETVIYDELSTP
ncbi:hypothetical protein BGZ59_005504, partial [Podila verticillata]